MVGRERLVFIDLLLKLSARGWRLFRNVVGGAVCGEIVKEYNAQTEQGAKNLVVTLEHARHVTMGLGTGTADGVGWRQVTITLDMVGAKIAQFVAIEVKTKSYKKRTDKQTNFLKQVAQAGGFAATAYERKDGSIDIVEIKEEEPEDA